MPVDLVAVPVEPPFDTVLSSWFAIVAPDSPDSSAIATLVDADTLGVTVTPVSDPAAIFANR